MKTRIYTLLIMIAGAVLVTSCGPDERRTVAEMPAVRVQVAALKNAKEADFVEASGRVEATKSANLSTRMMGYVTSVQARVGQQVQMGQVLVSVNNADLVAKSAQAKAGVTQAEAAFTNAEKDFQRFKTLYDQGSASQKELDDMTTRYEMAQAARQAALQMQTEVQAQFAYADIRAPFSGVVTNTYVKAGDMANPGMPLMGMEAPGDKEVTAMVAESDIDAISEGAAVQVIVKSLGKTVAGKVTEVSHSARNTGGQYLVKVSLQTEDASILSGMFVNVRFPEAAASGKEAVLVPERALVRNGQLTGIYTVGAGNVAILRWLKTGRILDGQVEVLSGLSADESCIVAAEGKLFNGAKVTF